jgi:hypothetical protein
MHCPEYPNGAGEAYPQSANTIVRLNEVMSNGLNPLTGVPDPLTCEVALTCAMITLSPDSVIWMFCPAVKVLPPLRTARSSVPVPSHVPDVAFHMASGIESTGN